MGITINGTKYLTIQETADYLGREYSEVTNLIHYHRALETIKHGGGRFVTLASAEAVKARQQEAERKEKQETIAHAA